MRSLFFLVFGFVGLLMLGCDSRSRKPNVELIQDMMLSPALEAQELARAEGEGGQPRRPPEGTKPIGFQPYTFSDTVSAEAGLVNPLPMSDEVLYQGQKMYYTYCFVCHGSTGAGDGPVSSYMMVPPPTLLSETVRGWKDGGIYHMIVAGRGLMGSFASQIPNESDRWALVHFVRHLQEAQK